MKRATGVPACILIVDDEAAGRAVLEVMLAGEGCRLRFAASGEEALRSVADEPPDLILLDVLMPGIGGYETAAKLKRNVATKNIPVIMISALDDREAMMAGLKAGAEDFLAKPVDRDEMCIKVRNLLRLKAHADVAIANRDHSMGMVSHELRNMLNGIVLSATMLAEEGGDVGDRMARLRRFAALMDRLIGDLVDVVSIDAGKLSLRPAPASAERLLREALETCAAPAAAKAITLGAGVVAPGLVAQCDRERVLQVLTNLVGNAVKFTPRGGSITVGASVDGEDLLLSVADTGPGIRPDMLEAVFERYRQVGIDDRRGLGLGLYISKCIVESHGGRIWVESRLGHGSTFLFTIPGGVAVGPDAQSSNGSAPRNALAPGSLGRVLVVDNDEAMCETLAAYLARRGFAVSWRTSPIQGLALLASQRFNAAVTDLNMDEIDGIEFCKRAANTYPSLPIILTTAFATAETNVAAIEVGAYEFISKPFDLEFLERILARAVVAGGAAHHGN